MRRPSRIFSVAGATLWLSSICLLASSVEEPKTDKVEVLVSSFSPKTQQTVVLEDAFGKNVSLTIRNSSVSDWQKVSVPATVILSADEDGKVAWSPSDPKVSEWILVVTPEDKEGLARIVSVPASDNLVDGGTVCFVNLMPYPVIFDYNGRELRVEVRDYLASPLRGSIFSLAARTPELPYRCEVLINGLDASERFLFVISEPHIKGSARMTHRLVRVSKFDPDSEEE